MITASVMKELIEKIEESSGVSSFTTPRSGRLISVTVDKKYSSH